MTATWIISQVLMIIYIRFTVWHNAPSVNAFRAYLPINNPYEVPFHRHGAARAIIVAIIIALGLWAYQPLIWCIASPLLSACWYWLLFDPWLNASTHRNWDYLGESARIDRWLKNTFGSRAGEIKFVVLWLVIGGVNLIRFL